MIPFIILFTAISLSIYCYVKKKQNFWEERGIKYLKPTFLLGNFEIFRSKAICESIKDFYDKYPNERYVGMYQFLRPVLFIRDADLIKKITVKDFDYFVDHQVLVTSDVDPFWGKNLISSQGEKWRDLRATLSPTFTGSKMRIIYNLIEECALQFVDFFKTESSDTIELDMKDAARRYANDVIASTAFGLKCNSLRDKNNDFYLMGKEAANFNVFWMLKFFTYALSPTLYKLLRIKVFPKKVSDYFTSIISDTLKIREEQKIVRPDMIHLLMESKKARENENIQTSKHKDKLTTEDITSHAFNFFVAGFETVSTLINFLFYELAIHPDIQNRLRDEINSVKNKINYDSLQHMKYLDMVVSESLRKWPVTVVADRQVTKDYIIDPKLPGEKPVLLKKGQVCFFPTFAIQNDPKYFPNPEKFDPERFNEENKNHIHPFAYIPFGSGPRMCIGNRFALLEIKLIVFHLLKNFEVYPVKKTLIPMVLDKNQFTMTAKGGMWLGLKKIY